jgi:HSP20 family protein
MKKKDDINWKKSNIIEKKWSPPEGELAVDFYQTDKEIIVQSAVAAVDPNNIKISVDNDILTIKGSREKKFKEEGANCFIEECYWGSFSRKIIIPDEIDASRIDASMNDGILTIRIPRVTKKTKEPVKIKEN